MKIVSHKLVSEGTESPIAFIPTPNKGGVIHPQYLIIHFTAGRNNQSSIDWMTNPSAQASAHVIIGLDGTVTQLVEFNKKPGMPESVNGMDWMV